MRTAIASRVKSSQSVERFATFCILLFVLSFSCSSAGKEEEKQEDTSDTWTITISGKVGFRQQGQILIQEIKDGALGRQDTIQLRSDYTFAKKFQLSEPGYYRLNFYNKQMLNVILDKSNLEVNVDGNNPQGFYEVKGSADMDLIRHVQELQQKTNESPEMAKLNQDYTAAAQRKDEATMVKLQQDYHQMIKKTNDEVATLMIEKSPSLAVINLLQSGTLDKDQYFETYVAVADKLKQEWPDYSHSKSFIALVDKLKTTAIGQPAPEIALPNPEGEIVKLSSLRGKYVLVDFWAKWCGPCRQENPNVVRVYNRYKDKGFTVFGVSLDRTKEDWLKAIQEDNLTWTHVSDLKFWQSEAAKTYGITGIPFSILVDPNGIIIAKNLRGAALDQKVAEVVGGK